MSVKIAVNAGHYYNTPGRRCTKKFDPAGTREWTMNARVAEAVISGLAEYEGVETLRIDDPTGKVDYELADRANKANKWGADYYIGIHHNGGVNGGSGGGTVVYMQTGTTDSIALRKAVYDAMIAFAGLRGNRSTPLANANFAETRLTKMPAVLVECGFMDSSVDAPLICKPEMSKKFADGIVVGMVKLCGLKKKVAPATEVQATKPAAAKNPYKEPTATVYKGCAKGDAVKWVQYELKRAGFDIGSSGIDGSCGPATDKAIRAFQKKYGLAVDGRFGPASRKKIKAV